MCHILLSLGGHAWRKTGLACAGRARCLLVAAVQIAGIVLMHIHMFYNSSSQAKLPGWQRSLTSAIVTPELFLYYKNHRKFTFLNNQSTQVTKVPFIIIVSLG